MSRIQTLQARARRNRSMNQRGFAVLPMLMVAVILAVVVTAFVAQSDTSGLRNQAYTNAAAQVATQANFIRARILLCGSDYPDGVNGTSYRPALPAAPTATAVSALICPGTGQNLWVGTDGVTLPVAPAFMTSGWAYTNDGTSARLTITGDTRTLTFAAQRLGADAALASNQLTFLVSN
ncbi:hypothetical protein [Burkholderia ambifaria]|uniref:hypothetical protein n=1 Tax=Burkholderia ambifaria TaxID=152480 RepID=UPI000F80A0CB|nr:hypothetical protein [Burkholderia ambifaria]